jgi:hypothetical protein
MSAIAIDLFFRELHIDGMLKMASSFVRLEETLNVRAKYASSFFSPAALPGHKRVSARWGRAGENSDHLEHPSL